MTTAPSHRPGLVAAPHDCDLLDAKLREFNPRYLDAEGALLGQFSHLHTDIYGNRGKLIQKQAYIVKYCD